MPITTIFFDVILTLIGVIGYGYGVHYNALLRIDKTLAADLWTKYTAAGGK